MEPHGAVEDTDLQKALEESMKATYALPRGPLPPVVIRKPESGKYQPLPKVPGKGKAKVSEEQIAHDLLSLQKHKKISPQINTYSKGASLNLLDPPDMMNLHMLCLDSQTARRNQKRLCLRQMRVVKMKAGSNPNETSEGQARPDPGDAGAKVQSILSPVVHAGSDREHIDLDVADVSPQPSTKQVDEGFTATAYPKQHLSKDISFGDLFFSDRPSDVDKNAEIEVESMVNVLIQQVMSSISLMTSPIIDITSRPKSPKAHQQFKATTTDTTTITTTTLPPHAPQQSNVEAMLIQRIGKLEHIMANLIQVNKDMDERLDKHGACLHMLEQLAIPHQVSKAISEVVTDAVDWAMQAPLRNHFRDLPEADMKEILHQRMWETESYKTHEDHTLLFEALKKSMNRDHSKELAQDLAEAGKKKKKSRESPKTPPGSPPHHPPPPPPPAGPSGASGALELLDPPKCQHHHHLHLYPPIKKVCPKALPSISLTPADLEMDEDMAPDEQAQLSDDEDIGSAHILMVNLRQDWWKPLEEERPARPEPACVDDPILRNNVSKPLPLGGLPGQVTIQSDLFFNKDLEYLRYSSKGCRPALSISKMKAAYYPDARLEQMVPDQFWIDEECKYDIAAMYGISHWWFQRQRFYIDRHTSEGDRNAVRTHMRILGVVRIEVFSMYGYDYMKKIVFRRVDLNEHVIAERDFKYLYPSDFEDLYLLNLQGHLNHLPPKDKKILTTAVNQWTRQLEGHGSVQGIHVRYSEAFEDKANLLQPGELCWWTRLKGRLQAFEAYRMIKSFRHSRPLSNDFVRRSYALSWKTCQGDSLNLPDPSKIKMIQVKEMMQDKDLKNSKSKDEGSRSRSQSMNKQSHYNQAKAKTKINKATSYKNGASCTQRKVSCIPFVFSILFVLIRGGNMSPDSFLPSILLLVVIIAMVVVMVVVVVVVGGVPSVLKLSFMVIVWGQYFLIKSLLNSDQVILYAFTILIGWANEFHQNKASSGPKASRALSKKRSKPKSKKTLIKVQVTPPTGPKKDSEQSHSESDDNEDEFAAGVEMDEDILPTNEEAQSSPQNTDKPESSHAQETDELDFDSSCLDALKKYDNILLLTERQLVKYLRKVFQVFYGRITEDQWAYHEEVAVSYATLADKAILSGADNRHPCWKKTCMVLGKATLADKAILSGADNRPPMLEKDMYGSWKTTQADWDVKAKNIILQGLPLEVYALVSNHQIAEELWERIQLLMQRTSLTKQERECKLYDEFDKFAFNTKFLNTLPPKWSKFMTYVKLVRDLHTTNIDQLHAYLGQHKFHANEVCLMHERNSDPLVLVATHQMTQSPYQNHQNSFQNSQFQPQVSQYGSPYQSSTPLSITYPSNDYQSSVHHNVYSPPSFIPQLEYAPIVTQQQQQSEFP
nr:hypothetical protein [Tanacetum cinerariifolium]